MLFTQKPRLKTYLFPFGKNLNKIILSILVLLFILFILGNSDLEYWLFKQSNHFSDCAYWQKKTDNEISTYFNHQNDYVKTRATRAFFDCHIKQATPFIISVFSIKEMPSDKFNFLTLSLNMPFSYQDIINNQLLSLWGLPQDNVMGDEHQFQGQKTIQFWNTYYEANKNKP